MELRAEIAELRGRMYDMQRAQTVLPETSRVEKSYSTVTATPWTEVVKRSIKRPRRQAVDTATATARAPGNGNSNNRTSLAGSGAGTGAARRVSHRHPRHQPRRQLGSVGTGVSNLVSLAPTTAIHLWKLHPDTTSEDIDQFLKNKNILKDISFKILKLNSKGDYSSFKITFPLEMEPICLTSSFWPSGACFKKFFTPKKSYSAPRDLSTQVIPNNSNTPTITESSSNTPPSEDQQPFRPTTRSVAKSKD
jgi:hypothetical protein